MSTRQALPLSRIYDYEIAPDGTPLVGQRIKVTLTYDLGITPSPLTSLQSQPLETVTDENGYWTLLVVPNDAIQPAGTGYVVNVEGYRTCTIVVLTSCGTNPGCDVATLCGSGSLPPQPPPVIAPSGTVVDNDCCGLTPTAGVAATYSRGDHSHGSPPCATTVVSETAFGQAPAVGTSCSSAREDHTHGTPAAPSAVNPATTVTDDRGWNVTPPVVGTSLLYARQDHDHGSQPLPHVPGSFMYNIDGGGAAIPIGTARAAFKLPPNSTITKVSLFSDVAANAVLDIWKAAFASYPPNVGGTITAAAKPTLAASDHEENATLTGWTTAVGADDVFFVHVDSCDATIGWLSLVIEFNRQAVA